MALLPPSENPDRLNPPAVEYRTKPAAEKSSVSAVLSAIAAGYPPRVAELLRLSVAYRSDPTLESSRRYIMALEALVATALRNSTFGEASQTQEVEEVAVEEPELA